MALLPDETSIQKNNVGQTEDSFGEGLEVLA